MIHQSYSEDIPDKDAEEIILCDHCLNEAVFFLKDNSKLCKMCFNCLEEDEQQNIK